MLTRTDRSPAAPKLSVGITLPVTGRAGFASCLGVAMLSPVPGGGELQQFSCRPNHHPSVG